MSMKKKTVALIVGATMLVSLSAGAMAATKLEQVKAYLNPNLTFKLNGEVVKLTDSNGKSVVAINYNNTNYLPVRAVSNLLDTAVNYDAKTDTINIGEKIDGTPISSNFKDMYYSKDPNHTTYNGKDYKEVFYDNGTSKRSVSFMLYPKGQYQTLTLKLAVIGGQMEDFTILDSENRIILKQVELVESKDGLIEIKVDIGGVSELYINGNVEKGTNVLVPLIDSYYK